MARNGSGDFSLLATLAPANTVSNSTSVNSTMVDIALALTESINKDGTKAWVANQSLGGNKFTSVGDGTARTDSIALGQVQDGKANWVVAGGTADALTATYAPAITTLVDGQICFVRAGFANATTTPTFAPNGLTARTIVKEGGNALVAGSIKGADHELILRYKLASTRWELLNPSGASAVSANSTTEVLTGTDTTKFTTADSLAALWEKGSDIASAGTISVGEGGYFHITGTTTITDIDFGTAVNGRHAVLIFDGALTLTHNATTLPLPGSANITTAAGDILFVWQDNADNVKTAYHRISGQAVVSSGGITLATEQATTSGTSFDFTGIPAGTKRVTVMLELVSTNAAALSPLMIQIGDSGGIEATGYSQSSSAGTTGFEITPASAAAATYSGSVTLSLQDSSNTWVSSSIISRNGNTSYSNAGSKQTTATLDRIRLTAVNGTDAFDAGSVNISYE
jgi:hypothetical protein